MTIRELRRIHKLSQSEMAKKIGVDPSTIGHMENGRMKVSPRIADRIWEEFGVEVIRDEDTKPVRKARAGKLMIYVQSPLGGNITPEEIAGKVPADTEAVFVRVDQNKLWWVKNNGETGSVDIWD